MKMFSSLLILCSCCIVFAESFFLLLEKNEPTLFCLKVCPLYCSPHRRSDDDASSFIYADDEFPYPYIEHLDHPPHKDRFVYPYCKHDKPTSPKPTTSPMPTSPKPTTTTEEPTWICMVCIKKCNYPA